MKVSQKMINLLGVTLLLVSTFLSPVGAVAQTQTATPTATAKLQVKKELIGRQLKDNEFEFTLSPIGGSVIQTKKNKADGTVTFDSIEFTKPGQYDYIIQEVKGSDPGIVYETRPVYARLTVVEENGQLKVSDIKYESYDRRTNEIPEPNDVFTNYYTPTDTSVRLEVKKELIGRQLKENEFSFSLKEKDTSKVLQTVTNTADGKVQFDVIKYDKAGTYRYTITENAGNVAGVEYDTNTIYATVTVAKEGGKLKITKIEYEHDGETSKPTFTNKYTSTETSAKLEAKKELIGRELKADEFDFELKEEGQAGVLQTVKNTADGKINFKEIKYKEAGVHKYTITEKKGNLSGIVYDARTVKATVTVTNAGNGKLRATVMYEGGNNTFKNTYLSQKTSAALEVDKVLTGRKLQDQEFEFELKNDTTGQVEDTAKNDANGKVRFKTLEYNKVGEYKYTITERKGSLGGIKYDKKEIKATVKVTDDGNGQLVAQVTYDKDEKEFHNIYVTKETTAKLEANKVLTGRTLNDGEFSFDLIAPDGTVVETVKNDKDGKISFKALTFKAAGTYVYTIKEKAGNADGVKYDTHTVKATVTVTDDGQGQLHASVAYENNDRTFNNIYSADKATATLSAKKLLEGRSLKAGEFEFELKGTEDNVHQIKKNNADGSVTFDTLEYTKAGVYHYTITEKAGQLGGVKYDTHTVKATVTVTDVGNGHFVTKVTYENNDQTFKNTYVATKTNAQLSVKKNLTGRALKTDEFEFELKGTDDKVIQTKKNTANGDVNFDTIEYTKAGTYHYTITEKVGNLSGVTYDKKTIKATVTVTDDGNGQLHATVSYEKDNQTFHNTYTPDPAKANFVVTKKLTGRALKAGEFDFELKNEQGTTLQTKKNGANGAIHFDAIEYTKAGTYHYTITEKDTKLSGVTYDKKVIKVTVIVMENSSGQLETKVSYDKDVKTFENRYTPPSTPPKKDLPKTGTVVHYLAFFVGIVLLAGAVYLIKKKVK